MDIMDKNDEQIDERKLTELDEEVSNYLEMENINTVHSKEPANNPYPTYLNNQASNQKNFNKYKEDLYYESKLDTCSSVNNYNNHLRYILK